MVCLHSKTMLLKLNLYKIMKNNFNTKRICLYNFDMLRKLDVCYQKIVPIVTISNT